VNYSTAKTILRIWRSENRVNKKLKKIRKNSKNIKKSFEAVEENLKKTDLNKNKENFHNPSLDKNKKIQNPINFSLLHLKQIKKRIDFKISKSEFFLKPKIGHISKLKVSPQISIQCLPLQQNEETILAKYYQSNQSQLEFIYNYFHLYLKIFRGAQEIQSNMMTIFGLKEYFSNLIEKMAVRNFLYSSTKSASPDNSINKENSKNVEYKNLLCNHNDEEDHQ
jgi:hypothetical protein